MRGPCFRRLFRAGTAGVALTLVACSPAPARSGTFISITEKDFAITSPPFAPSGGDFTLDVTNLGPATHEFIVVRSGLPADQLPIGPDGLSVDEDALSSVAEINQVDYGSTQTLHLSLAPGRYVFFCNLEGHYLGGMHAALVVG